MGWSFACDTSQGKKQLIERLRRPSRFGDNNKLLQACTVGNHHWYLAKTTWPDGTAVTWIGLDLLQGGGRTSGWGYKDMDESCGPCHYDCPISYLDKASEPTGHAIEWRRKVRAHHAAKKARPEYAAGQVWQFGQHEYRLSAPSRKRRGWLAVRVSDGHAFRVPFTYLARATLVPAATQEPACTT